MEVRQEQDYVLNNLSLTDENEKAQLSGTFYGLTGTVEEHSFLVCERPSIGYSTSVSGDQPALSLIATGTTLNYSRDALAVAINCFIQQAKANIEVSTFEEFSSKPFSEQVNEVQNAINLNKSELADIFQVSRPAVYSWFKGTPPRQENRDRLLKIIKLMCQSQINSKVPLNKRFVKQPLTERGLSLLDLLKAHDSQERVLLEALKKAKELSSKRIKEKQKKEEELSKRGYEKLTAEERELQLDNNLTMIEWDD